MNLVYCRSLTKREENKIQRKKERKTVPPYRTTVYFSTIPSRILLLEPTRIPPLGFLLYLIALLRRAATFQIRQPIRAERKTQHESYHNHNHPQVNALSSQLDIIAHRNCIQQLD